VIFCRSAAIALSPFGRGLALTAYYDKAGTLVPFGRKFSRPSCVCRRFVTLLAPLQRSKGAAPTALPRQAGAGDIIVIATPALPGWADVWRAALRALTDESVVSHISRKTSEMWGTADSAYKCNISRIGDSCNMPRGFRHLDLSERVFLETQLSHGRRPARIAAELKRARSTITREIRRNGWRAKLRKGSIAGGYRSVAADRRARVLSVKPRRPRKLKAGNQLWMTMLRHLRRGLSPVQIASTLARMADPVRLSHEAIYTALYAMPRGQLRASLLDLLRRRHKARRPARGKNGRSHSIPDMTLIDRRPMEVNERLIPGHWEGDLIIGKGNLSQVGILVERKSLFVALVKLPNGKADTVAERFTKIFKRFESRCASP
jgi:IS30 family transposase